MKHKIRILIISAAFIQVLCAEGQTIDPFVISSIGGLNNTPTMLVSWTLGELVSGTNSNSVAILTQGFQPNDIEVISSFIIPEYQKRIKVYPIPADNQINIEFDTGPETSYEVSLYSLAGQLLLSSFFNSSSGVIDITALSTGQYILTVSSNSGETISNYKIIKK